MPGPRLHEGAAHIPPAHIPPAHVTPPMFQSRLIAPLLIRAVAAALLALMGTALAADPEPLRLSHDLEVEGRTIRVPMELYLTPQSETDIAVKVAGNLRALQRQLPALLSDVVQDDCRMRVGLQIDETLAEGDHIRGRGRVQVQFFRCNAEEDKSSRRRLISHITAVDALMLGGIRDNCLDAELKDLTLDPSGLVGAALNITGLTRRIEATVRTELNEILNEDQNCLDLPEALQLLDTTITSGGFRDFGGGEMGFVVKGRVTVNAQNVTDLLTLIDRQGRLDGR
ncbi:MAG: hypothetical protein NXH97_04470 [Rhodobacteraceae bacterium]|nr:hypothetical protein [Paracoccaceae bacterium]